MRRLRHRVYQKGTVYHALVDDHAGRMVRLTCENRTSAAFLLGRLMGRALCRTTLIHWVYAAGKHKPVYLASKRDHRSRSRRQIGPTGSIRIIHGFPKGFNSGSSNGFPKGVIPDHPTGFPKGLIPDIQRLPMGNCVNPDRPTAFQWVMVSIRIIWVINRLNQTESH